MTALSAAMFDLTSAGVNAAALGEVLFLTVGAVVTALLAYGLRKQTTR
jgi:hypothetical protein